MRPSGSGLLAALAVTGLAWGPVVPAEAQDLTYLKRVGERWVWVTRSQGGFRVGREAPPPAETSLRRPAGSFDPYQVYPTGAWAEAVATGDVNGDDGPDVVVVTSAYSDPANDDKAHVFLQTTNRPIGLAPQVKYDVGTRPQSVAIGDVNGDKRNDVIVANDYGVGVLYQNEQGTLDPVLTWPTADHLRVRTADLNNDGRLDIVSLGWGTNSVSVFLQRPDGSLAPATVYAAQHAGYDDLEVGDVNEDGLADVIVMSGQLYAVPDLSVLYQQPDGTLGGLITRSVGGNDLAGGVGVGDFNGDGRDDIALAMGWAGGVPRIALFEQDSSGSLPVVPPTSATYSYPEPLEVGDVTGDGRQDVVFSEGSTLVGIKPQLPGGVIGPEVFVPVPYATHLNRHGLAVGDINLDGLNDIVIANYNYGLVVLRQNGSAGVTVGLSSDVAPQ